MKPAVDRFWANVDKRGPDECWDWKGGRAKRGGYGKLGIGNKTIVASRFSYELHHGPAGELHVCHRCDNPPCCNPAHLFLGTIADNMRDKAAKGRCRVPAGEAHYAAKITAADVLTIWHSSESHTVLARRYGLTPNSVRAIHDGRSWTSLTGGQSPYWTARVAARRSVHPDNIVTGSAGATVHLAHAVQVPA